MDKLLLNKLTFMYKLIGCGTSPLYYQPIIDRAVKCGRVLQFLAHAQMFVVILTVGNMSASMVRATVRAVSKRKILPTRAALTLVSDKLSMFTHLKHPYVHLLYGFLVFVAFQPAAVMLPQCYVITRVSFGG